MNIIGHDSSKPEKREYTLQSQSGVRLQSQVLDWLRFPLVVAVVFAHSFGPDLPAGGPSCFVVSDWIRILFSRVLTLVAVPGFFAISGLFFFWNIREWGKEAYKHKLKTRAHTLLIPYIIWNTIAILVPVITDCFHVVWGDKPVGELVTCIKNINWLHAYWDVNWWNLNSFNAIGFSRATSGPQLIPLWFVRDLMVLVVLTPVIYSLIKRLRWGWLAIVGTVYLSNLAPNLRGLTVSDLFWFSFGAWFGINKVNMVITLHRPAIRYTAYILMVILLPLRVYYEGADSPIVSIIAPAFTLTATITTFCIATGLIMRGAVKDYPLLGKSTFFVYCLHTVLVLEFCAWVMGNVLPGNSQIVVIVRYFATPFLCAAACFAIWLLMRRYMPRLLGVLAGSRK